MYPGAGPARENGKAFVFAQPPKSEVGDPDLSFEMLINEQTEEFKDYANKFPPMINARDRIHGNVPLHIACSKGDLSLIHFLLSNGAYINIGDVYGNSPLHYATDKSKKPAMEMLLNNGANPNQQDNRGNTPLHVAATNNDVDSVKLLLSYNCDPELPDFSDIRPQEKTRSPMIRGIIEKKIESLRGGDERAAAQTVQWMSFGVGLGVGLGVALAKNQQHMMEGLFAKHTAEQQAAKGPRRIRGATPNTPTADIQSHQIATIPENSSTLVDISNANAGALQRKFLV